MNLFKRIESLSTPHIASTRLLFAFSHLWSTFLRAPARKGAGSQHSGYQPPHGP